MSSRFVPIEKADLEWHKDLPFSKKFQDIYFSKDNGLSESLHVFINGNALMARWQALKANQSEQFIIAETGFGSGLNFLLSWKYWLEHAPADACLQYISCEKYPLAKNDLIKALSLWPELSDLAQELIENYPVLTPGFHHITLQEGRVKLTLMLGDVLDCYEQLLLCGESSLESMTRKSAVDAWYLDGFSPAKNEAMWTSELFSLIALLSKKGTTLATFSAAKIIKDNLKRTGFSFSKAKGFARKRDMILAVCDASCQMSLRKKMTPWHCAKPIKIKEKKAIVIGAGLAGCFNAYALAQRGWQVSLLDANQDLACGASAIHQAVVFPKLSAYQSPLTAFMLMSFLHATRFYKKQLQDDAIAHLHGALLLAHSNKESASQAAMQSWLGYYPELGCLLDKDSASELAGIPLPYGGLYIPDSGWVDTRALCQRLVAHELIRYYSKTKVDHLDHHDGLWQAADHQAEVVIIANGYQSNQFSQTRWLPINPIRGQMTSIAASQESSLLKIPLCAHGHLLPSLKGRHWLGASYDLGAAHADIKVEDDRLNMTHLKQYAATLDWSDDVIDSWASVRGSTPDYLPMVGPVANQDDFKLRYHKFSANSKQWIPETASHHEGLYISAAFGSRGLSTIPLAAEYLAAQINQEFSILPRALAQAISPQRFLKKNLDRTKPLTVA